MWAAVRAEVAHRSNTRLTGCNAVNNPPSDRDQMVLFCVSFGNVLV